MKNFIIVGVSGFVADRHLSAIKNTNNNLLAAFDINENVGKLDTYFPDCKFYKKLSNLKSFIKKSKKKIHYLSVCTPNHLHFKHIKFGLENNLDIICEKPIVINKSQFNKLDNLSKRKNKKVFSILQLRNHPSLLELKKKIDNSKKIHKVEIVYYTYRGDWYFKSWKGNSRKSGGIMLNIGVHFFDMLIWIFGNVLKKKMIKLSSLSAQGELLLDKANVSWKLSLDKKDISKITKNKVYRSIKVDGKEIEFSKIFNDLHTLNYKSILNSKESNLLDAFKAINLINSLKKDYEV